MQGAARTIEAPCSSLLHVLLVSYKLDLTKWDNGLLWTALV